MNVNKRLLAGIIAGALLWLTGFYHACGRLTYIERSCINEDSMWSLAAADGRTVLEQEFLMPFELLWSVEIKVGTSGRNNNSFWQAEIREKESGKRVYGWKCNASEISDGAYHSFTVNSPVRMKQGEQYVLSIWTEDADESSTLTFYASGADTYAEGRLFLNGNGQKGDLCMRITGGEKDGFWSGWYLTVTLVFLGMAVWYIRRKRCGKSARLLAEAAGTACLYFIFMYIFSRSNTGSFTDEWDNMWGGMLIAKGKVLYRDYYTQHTPFGYYLCAVFALLGAKSIQQFRLLYYLLSAAVWGGLYHRHSSYFGKGKMLLLPLLQVWILMPMFFQSPKILADNIQGLCMIVLVMEFMRYWEDEELGRGRSLTAAACIFVSITSAFVSVFAIAPLAVGTAVKEVLIWKRKKGEGFGIKSCADRYGCFLGAVVLPFGMMLFYFACTHAIGPMYRMAYQFNTMVYNTYQEQYGRVKWKPFFLGVKGFFTLVSSNFNKVITASGNSSAVIQLLLAVSAAAAILVWGRKQKKGERISAAAVLFLFLCGNGTRIGTTDEFHAAALWDVALTLMVLTGICGIWHGKEQKKRAAVFVSAILSAYFLQPYITMAADHVVYHPDIVEGIDAETIAVTEQGEGIFVDAVINNPVYLMYKGRYPINRNGFLLPWYMDWFEQDTVEDLETKMPEIAVYNPEVEVWGQTGYCPLLDAAIQEHYERISEDSVVWKRKENEK